MKLNKNQLLFIGLNENLTEELYKICDFEINNYAKNQVKNRNLILDLISKVLISYNIVNDYLHMTYRDRKKEYNSMEKQINKILGNETKYESDKLRDLLKNVAYDRYNMNSYLMDLGIDFKLPKLDPTQVNKIINQKIKGKIYSDRIWNNKNKTAKDLKLAINDFLNGNMNVNDIIQLIKKKYNSNYENTKRLVNNEIGRVQSEINEQWFKEHDGEWVYYSATLDKRTCKDCGKYDNKTYKVSDSSRPTLPKHVRCRCCYILIVDPNWRPGARLDNESRENINYTDYKKWYNKIELYRKDEDVRSGLKFISDIEFDKLTIKARKNGALILRGTDEIEERLNKLGAAASIIGDVLFFRKNVCISEVLEETYHFEQNLRGLNNDKGEPLRSILNEIDAKEYLLKNAKKFKIPRVEIETTEKQLISYKEQLFNVEGK